MRPQKTLLKIIAMATLVATGAAGVFGQQHEGFTTQASGSAGAGQSLVTGMIGIVPGQTARMNVANWGDSAEPVSLVLFDGNGKQIFVSNAVIPAGKSLSEEFQWPCCGGAGVIRGQLSFQSKISKVQFTATLEVVDDQTGKTSMILPYVLLPAV